jgi:hypothetical protein
VWTATDTGGDATLGFRGGVLGRIHDRVQLGLDYTFFMLGVTSAVIGEPVGDDTVNLTLRWQLWRGPHRASRVTGDARCVGVSLKGIEWRRRQRAAAVAELGEVPRPA